MELIGIIIIFFILMIFASYIYEFSNDASRDEMKLKSKKRGKKRRKYESNNYYENENKNLYKSDIEEPKISNLPIETNFPTWSVEKAFELKILVDQLFPNSISNKSMINLFERNIELLEVNENNRSSNQIKKLFSMVKEAKEISEEIIEELLETENIDGLLLNALMFIPERIRSIASDRDTDERDKLGFLLCAEIQQMLITSAFRLLGVLDKGGQKIINSTIYANIFPSMEKRKEFGQKFAEYGANEKYIDEIYSPLMYMLIFELTERDEPNPKKIITLVDQVFPQVIGNVLAHQTDKAYELVQPIKTVLKKAGII